MINFNNTYDKLPDNFFEPILPEKCSHPGLISFNRKLAKELGIHTEPTDENELARVFSGQKILPGSNPIASHAGFNSVTSSQLGDGRAHLPVSEWF